MAIRLEQPGAAKAAAGAGTAIGKAQRAEEDRARTEREQVRAETSKARKQAQKAAMDWELQKMQMRSQQDFQQELAEKQWDYEKFNRAKEWDIEKLELRSRMDFEQEEKTRLREIDQIDSQILAVKKAKKDGLFTGREFEYESMLFNLEQQQFGIKNPSKPLDPQKRLLDQLTRGEITGPGDSTDDVGGPTGVGPVTVQQMEAIAAVGKTYLRRKDTGQLVEIPIGNAKDAVATGRFEFPEVVGTPTTGMQKKFPDITRPQETYKPQRGSFFF